MALKRLALFSLYFILVSCDEDSACKIEKDIEYLKQLWDRLAVMESNEKYSTLPGELSPLVTCPKNRPKRYDYDSPKVIPDPLKRASLKNGRKNCPLYYIRWSGICVKESTLH
ncbi:unnamed protein product [Colias eurytheme]|nr:unnamed protein product [Colias eurytheme]